MLDNRPLKAPAAMSLRSIVQSFSRARASLCSRLDAAAGRGQKEPQVGQEKSSGKYQHLQCLCTLMREHLVGHIQEDVVANRWICIARSSACWRGSV